MDIVDKSHKVSNVNDLDCGKVIIIKSNQGFNESNLMTLPIFSLKRKKVSKIERTWIKDNEEIGLTVIGSGDKGCPTIYELDVLMALFKLLLKSIDSNLVISSDNKVQNMPKVINFTYRKLAEEMGISKFGGKTKERLEKSIKCLTESTIYSNFSFRNQEKGEYIETFNGEQSCRILKNYKSYSVKKYLKQDKKLLSPKDIERVQSVEIDDFFFNNMCNNYFKLYDYSKYIRLTKGISKKLLLILTQWSHSYEKYINMQTLYDYIGLEVNTTQDEYYYNKLIKEALEELKTVKFIENYNFENGKGILFSFNATVKNNKLGLNKYTTTNETIGRLREIGIDYDDIVKYCRLDTMDYISALLRYIDDKESKGEIKDVKLFTLKGLPYERYDVKKYYSI